MSIRLLPLAAVAAAALALSACSSNSAVTGSADHSRASSAMVVASSSSATPTPSPAVWTRAEAAQQYLRIVAPYNAEIAVWNALPSNAATLATYTAPAAKIAAALDTEARQLGAGHWPEDARSAVADMVSKSLAERQYWQAVASATTEAQLSDAVSDPGLGSSAKTSGAAATAVRIALGLPSN